MDVPFALYLINTMAILAGPTPATEPPPQCVSSVMRRRAACACRTPQPQAMVFKSSLLQQPVQ